MKLRTILLVISIGVVFASCERASEEDISGIWIESDNTCSSDEISDCASIVFYPDGSAKFSNFDFDLFSEEDEKINFVGSWSLTLTEEPLDNNSIQIRIGANEVFPNGYRFPLYILLGSNDFLTFGLPDDAHILFEKEATIRP